MASTFDDKTLQEAFASLADGARPGDACPLPERIWAAIEGEIPVDERRELIDHIATCPSCAEDWRAAYRMGARPPAWWKLSMRGVPKRLHLPRMPRWVSQAALIATAALVVAVLVPLVQMDGPKPIASERVASDLDLNAWLDEEAAFRGDRKIEMVLPTTGVLTRENCWLRWSPLDGALYDLTVRTKSDELIVKVQALETAEYQLQAETLKKIDSGGVLVWFVDATLPSGQHISSSAFASKLK